MNCLFLIAMGIYLKIILYVFKKCPMKQQQNTNHASVKPYLISTLGCQNYPLIRNLFISPVYEMHSKQKHHN